MTPLISEVILFNLDTKISVLQFTILKSSGWDRRREKEIEIEVDIEMELQIERDWEKETEYESCI